VGVAVAFGLAFSVSFASTLVAIGCGAVTDDSSTDRPADARDHPAQQVTDSPALADIQGVETVTDAPRVSAAPATSAPEYECSCPQPWRAPLDVAFSISETWTTDEAGEPVSPAVAMTSGSIVATSDGEVHVDYAVEGVSVGVTYRVLPQQR
jgi:hypothetical protein